MAKPREFPVPDAPPTGGRSALKIVLGGALLAFGGYSAVAGASFLLGPTPPTTATAAKAEIDCESSRFAWRPECQEKAEAASAEGDGARRTRRRAAAAEESATAAAAAAPVPAPAPVQVAAVADPVATASVPPSPEVARPAAEAAVPAPKQPEPATEPVPLPPVRAVAREPSRPAPAANPSRERRAEPPRPEPARSKPEPEPAENSIRTGRARVEAPDEPVRARAKLVPARRDPAQFASLRRERAAERTRRTRLASAWRPDEGVGEPDGGEETARPRREERSVRRRVRGYDRTGLPSGMTVTSVRTYMLPDGRLVSVNVRPRADEVRALIAQHRANVGSYSYYPW